MKLYHISKCKINNKTFSPQIPIYHNQLENSTIPRISVSDSIEGCVGSINRWLGKTKNGIIEFDTFTEAWVYEFDTDDINPKNILNPKFIKENYFIFDAPYTKEHWIINQTVSPRDEYLVLIQNSEYKDTIFQHTHKEIERLKLLNKSDTTFTVRRFKKLKYTKCKYEEYLAYVNLALSKQLDFYKNQEIRKEDLLKYVDNQISLREHSNDEISETFKRFYKYIQAQS